MKFKISLLLIFTAINSLAVNNNIANALEKSMPAVVQLIIETAPPWNIKNSESRKELAESRKVGSGVILNSKTGIIITNAHLTNNAKNIVVTLNDGRHFIGKTLGMDLATDLAVIAIKPEGLGDINLKIGNTPKVGDFVIAIGNPFGLSQTVTRGIVSGINRHIGIDGIENFIQTDAPINPGNSGGALIDQSGSLVGINTAILSKSGGNIGIGFAIPMNIVMPIAKQLVEHGNIKRGMIGIVAQNMNNNLAKAMNLKHSKGALINQVIANSPAEKAGLKIEDLILAVNDDTVSSSAEVKSLIAVNRAESKVKLTLERRQKTLHINLKPALHIKDKATENNLLAGVSIENLDRILSNGKYIHGAKIINTITGSPAWLSGLKPQDMIIEVNHRPTQKITDLKKLAKTEKRLLLTILRNNHRLFLVLAR